jgi:hypothetical protein
MPDVSGYRSIVPHATGDDPEFAKNGRIIGAPLARWLNLG